MITIPYASAGYEYDELVGRIIVLRGSIAHTWWLLRSNDAPANVLTRFRMWNVT